MQRIPLTTYGGAVRDYAIVDDEDFAYLAQFRWHLLINRSGNAYASTVGYVDAEGRKRQVSMHRLLLGLQAGQLADHRDGDGLNNQRANLRLANRLQNSANAVRRCKRGSRYKGVGIRRQRDRFQAHLCINGVTQHLGTFASEEAAARAYDEAARIAFGEFACVNFPRPGERSAITGEIVRGAA